MIIVLQMLTSAVVAFLISNDLKCTQAHSNMTVSWVPEGANLLEVSPKKGTDDQAHSDFSTGVCSVCKTHNCASLQGCLFAQGVVHLCRDTGSLKVSSMRTCLMAWG